MQTFMGARRANEFDGFGAFKGGDMRKAPLKVLVFHRVFAPAPTFCSFRTLVHRAPALVSFWV